MNPLTVLEEVFTHLSVDDLKVCRTVNKAWCQEATVILRNSISNISIGTPAALRGVTTLSTSSHSVPFTKFNLSSHFFSLPNCAKTLFEFLSAFSPELQSLSITLDRESNPLPESELDHLKFTKLTKLTLTGHGLDTLAPCSKNGTEIPSIFKAMLSSSPRLESLSIIMDPGCRSTVKKIINCMTSTSLRNVSSLEIYIPVGDEEILSLSRIPFHLKKLKCDFHRSCFLPESFKTFLSAQSASLEHIKFDNFYGNSCYTVAFPEEMTRVVKLGIDGRSELSSKEVTFLPFNYNRQFPALRDLVLGGSIEFNTCWKILFPEDTTVASVKGLKLTARYVDPVWVGRIGVIFPNLEKLFFSLTPRNEELARVVFSSFKGTKELTVYFQGGVGNVDRLFLGEEEDDVGLANLKSLHTLRFKADKLPSSGQKACHISDLTVTNCLMKMTNLRNVIMPPFQISQHVLTQLSTKVNLHLT
ncbi:uncharacterized protein LOC110859724 isoform X2 [Folsomia candida]|uniref:uncharacterized protein LOC110859724 isoform X2 n=1 Tax=Folsomia candida TaxID=158441 RepID=UPI000B8F75EF|nr:uncharacterized protein LOC110859724 isoform X2 [Folsomia candida]